MQKLLFIFFIASLWAFTAVAQQDSLTVTYDDTTLEIKEISATDLQTYRDDPKFDYEVLKTESNWWTDFKTWLGNLFLRFFEWLFGVDEAVGYLALFFRLVPYILLGLLIFILIKFFLNVNARAMVHSKKNQALVSLSEEEHIIKNEDIQQLIQQALADKNYRLAIRYYYLYMLQLMSEKEIIVWELQKTNDDYLKEIGRPDLKKPFTKITRLYDYIWYGSFTIDETKYLKAETEFSALQKTLKNG